MEDFKKHRVEFYSKADMSSGNNLKSAEDVFKTFNTKNEFDINDILELYHIKQYFDNDMYLLSWNEEEKIAYKNKTIEFWTKITAFFLKMDNDNILLLFNQIEYRYYNSFWYLINKLEIYKKINSTTINEIFKNERFRIHEVLKHEKIVKYFQTEIKNYLIEYEDTAEIILFPFILEELRKNENLYFPKILSDNDKENIIIKYLNNERPNLNYLRLIVNTKNSELKLSTKTRLLAKNTSRRINDEMFNQNNSINYGVQVGLSKDQIEPIKISTEGLKIIYTYSESWIDEKKDALNLFFNFKTLFDYIDNYGLIPFVNKRNNEGTFERIMGLKSKNEYLTGVHFNQNYLASQAQLLIYLHYLKQNEIDFEDVMAFIVNDYLNKTFEIDELKIIFPSKSTTLEEKNLKLCTQMESLLKQYNLFVEDNYIDRELLEFSSEALNFSQIKSKTENKYFYEHGNKIQKLKHYFYSSQSSLHYIEPFKTKYKNLADLLHNENVLLDNFQNYQMPIIEELINENYLHLNENNFVRIKDEIFINIIALLYKDEVLCFHKLPIDYQSLILEMEKENMLISESTLFTKAEVDYFNYFLNSKFTNGLELRNKYVHGTNSNSIEQQKSDYHILLKLLILVILKITDDLVIGKFHL